MQSRDVRLARREQIECLPAATPQDDHAELKLPSIFGREQPGRRIAAGDDKCSLGD